MIRPLVFRRRVGEDLARAYQWYDARRRGHGDEFLAGVGTTFDAIERLPSTFARIHGEVRRAVVSKFPYAVFFQIEPSQVVALAVLHTARNPKLWPGSR